MTEAEKLVNLAAKLYEARRFARVHLGAKYREIVDPIHARFRGVHVNGGQVLDAMHGDLRALAQQSLTGPAYAVASAAIIAGALDVIDPDGLGDPARR